jgi:hypothetical protein
MFQHGGRLWFSRFASGNPPSATELISSDGFIVSNAYTLLSTRRATVMNAAISYRGHLFLSEGQGSGHYGTEPCILNSAPDVPIPPLLKGARKEQPFAFTYAQLITGTVTDAEGDTISPPAITAPHVGLLKRNGVAVTTETPILPGDTFEWTPPVEPVGNLEAFTLLHRDPWSVMHTAILIRVETPHDEWTRLHFSSAEIADPLVSGPQADADGDGVGNALEFVFGRHPRNHEPEAGVTFSGGLQAVGRRCVFTFTRMASLPPGTLLEFEETADLVTWGTLGQKDANAPWLPWLDTVTVNEQTLPDGRVQTTLTVEDLVTYPTFFRLRLVLP